MQVQVQNLIQNKINFNDQLESYQSRQLFRESTNCQNLQNYDFIKLTLAIINV